MDLVLHQEDRPGAAHVARLGHVGHVFSLQVLQHATHVEIGGVRGVVDLGDAEAPGGEVLRPTERAEKQLKFKR